MKLVDLDTRSCSVGFWNGRSCDGKRGMGWDVHVLASACSLGHRYFPPLDGPTTTTANHRPDSCHETLRAVLMCGAPVSASFVSVGGLHLSIQQRLNTKPAHATRQRHATSLGKTLAPHQLSLGPPGRIIFPAASYWLSIAAALLAIYHSGLHHPPFVSAPIVSPQRRHKLGKLCPNITAANPSKWPLWYALCGMYDQFARKLYQNLWDILNSA